MLPLVEPGEPLSDAERARYLRHLVLPQIGEVGQRRLKNARVLVAGAGGIGSPVLMTLAAAGVGSMRVVDDDTVEPSNLPRQLAFDVTDVGRSKAEAAQDTGRRLGPFGDIVGVGERITAETAPELVAWADLVLDGTDDAATRLVLHDAAQAAGVPYVWGTAVATDGLVSVFWRDAPGWDGAGPELRDLHPDPLVDTGVSCVATGVIAPVCQAVAAMMTGEALKLIVGYGEPLLGRVQAFDALDGGWREIPLTPTR